MERDPVPGSPGPDASDAARLARSRLEPEAFTGIYDRYFPVIHRYVAGRLGTVTWSIIRDTTPVAGPGQS
jgi:hypothetical protein